MSQIIQANVIKDLHADWTPHPGQIECLRAVFQKHKRLVVICCGRKWGKLLPDDTLIPTPSGLVELQDLVIGAVVFDKDGAPCRVVEIFTEDVPNLFDVKFSDGSMVTACEDHQWEVTTKASRKSNARAINPIDLFSIKTTSEMIPELRVGKEFNYAIPCAKAVQLDEKDFLLDPYLLGVWLGDGSSASASITGIDESIFDSFQLAGYEVVKTNRPLTRRVIGLFPILRKLGVVNNKHVPIDYLLGSSEQRLRLLRGLMDTDGTTEANGRCCFDNTKEALADAVCWLLSSLGQQYKREVKRGRLNGQDKKLVYRVKFYPTLNPFALERKRVRVRARKKPNHRFIVSISPVASRSGRCLSVDSPSRTYLVGENFIPTHNTEALAYIFWRWCNTYPNQVTYYIAPFATQAKEIIWASNRLQSFGPRAWIKKVLNNEMRIIFWNNSFIKVVGADNEEALRGPNPHLAAYEEGKDISPRFHTNFYPNLLDTGGPLVMIGTPPENDVDPKEIQFMNLCEEARSSHYGFFYTGPSWERSDNPAFLERLEEQRKVLVARDEEDVWLREYGGQFVKGGSKSIFAKTFLRKELVIPHGDMLQRLANDMERLEFFVLADPGTASIFAAAFFALDRQAGKIYSLGEIYEKRMEMMRCDAMYPAILAKCAEFQPDLTRWQGIYDEAALWFWNEMPRGYPISFLPTHKQAMRNEFQEAKPGVSLMKGCFANKTWLFSDQVINGVWEIESYAKDKNGNIPKKNDHYIDLCRYFLDASTYEPRDSKEQGDKFFPRQSIEDELYMAAWGEESGELNY